MRVLLTGAFGVLGVATIPALRERGHRVRAFDRPGRAARRIARDLGDAIEVTWGDVRERTAVAAAVAGQDAIVYLAGVLPPVTEEAPEVARAINVDGTCHLIAAAEASPQAPAIVFASSVAVFPSRHASASVRASRRSVFHAPAAGRGRRRGVRIRHDHLVAQALEALRRPLALRRRLEQVARRRPPAEHGGEPLARRAEPLLEHHRPVRRLDADLGVLLVHVHANLVHGRSPLRAVDRGLSTPGPRLARAVTLPLALAVDHLPCRIA